MWVDRMYELHPIRGTFLQLYWLTAMLRETIEEANKIIHSVVQKEKGTLIFKIKVYKQE